MCGSQTRSNRQRGDRVRAESKRRATGRSLAARNQYGEGTSAHGGPGLTGGFGREVSVKWHEARLDLAKEAELAPRDDTC